MSGFSCCTFVGGISTMPDENSKNLKCSTQEDELLMSARLHRQPLDLTGRVALVTGAGVGIGRATALSLASAGAMVGVQYNSSAVEARQTLDEIVRMGSQGIVLQGDLTQEDQANCVVDRLVEQ